MLLLLLLEAARAVVFTDSLSLMTSLMSNYSLAGSRRALASPHTPMMSRIADLLASRQGHVLLVKVKSHMGLPLNAAADVQAEIGLASARESHAYQF